MAVDPAMMAAGMGAPMIPPPLMGAPMAAPMAPPAAPMGGAPPAVEALPGIAALAQQQTIEMLQHEKQMMEISAQIDLIAASAFVDCPICKTEQEITFEQEEVDQVEFLEKTFRCKHCDTLIHAKERINENIEGENGD